MLIRLLGVPTTVSFSWKSMLHSTLNPRNPAIERRLSYIDNLRKYLLEFPFQGAGWIGLSACS